MKKKKPQDNLINAAVFVTCVLLAAGILRTIYLIRQDGGSDTRDRTEQLQREIQEVQPVP